jgi:hypothetical protein
MAGLEQLWGQLRNRLQVASSTSSAPDKVANTYLASQFSRSFWETGFML